MASSSPPPPAWMHKPRSKLSAATSDNILLGGLGAGVNTLRSLGGGDHWQRRYVFYDPTSHTISYGKGPTSIDKGVPLASLQSAEMLSAPQLLEMRAPAHLAQFGWSMGDGHKQIVWACEDADSREHWVSFVNSELQRMSRAGGAAVVDGSPLMAGGEGSHLNQQHVTSTPTSKQGSSSQRSSRTTRQPRGSRGERGGGDIDGARTPTADGLDPSTTTAAGDDGSGATNTQRSSSPASRAKALLALKPIAAPISTLATRIGKGGRNLLHLSVGAAGSLGNLVTTGLGAVGEGIANGVGVVGGNSSGSGGGKPSITNCRCEVTAPGSTTSAASDAGSSPTEGGDEIRQPKKDEEDEEDPPTLTPDKFQINLIRKFDNVVLYMVQKTWADVEAFASMVRSIAPKTELPSVPTAAKFAQQGGVDSVEFAEARHAYVHKLCEAALESGTLVRLPEVHAFVGFTAYSEAYDHAMRSGAQSPKLRRRGGGGFSGNRSFLGNTFESILGGTANGGGGVLSRSSNGGGVLTNGSMANNGSMLSVATAAAAAANSAASKAQESKNDVAQCFRIMDEASSGYAESQDLKGFFAALYPPEDDGLGGGALGANGSAPLRNATSMLLMGGNTPYYTSNTMPDAVQSLIEASHKANDGAYNAPAFVKLVKDVSKLANVSVEDWVSLYRKNWFCAVYSAFGAMGEGVVTMVSNTTFAGTLSSSPTNGSSSPPLGSSSPSNNMTNSFVAPLLTASAMRRKSGAVSPMNGGGGGGGNNNSFANLYFPSPEKFDQNALITLKYVVTESGLRVLSSKELSAFKQADVTYTQTLDEFLELMGILSDAITLEELLNVLVKARHSTRHSSMMRLVNEKAADLSYAPVINRLRMKMRALTEVKHTGGKCANCEAVEARLRSLRGTNDALEEENEALNEALGELEDECDDLNAALSQKNIDYEILKAELAAAKAELARARTREETFAARLLAADAEVKRLHQAQEQQAAANEGDVTQHSTLYFLSPMSFGSSRSAPVVDLPGALVYNLPDSFAPLGISMDVYLTGTSGKEYLSCRDGSGRRSIGWTLSGSDGQLTVPGTLQTLQVPIRQWTRVQARVSWAEGRFDLYLNGTVAMSRIPLRDEGTASIAVLDVYPRHDVVVCYANMNFFSSDEAVVASSAEEDGGNPNASTTTTILPASYVE